MSDINIQEIDGFVIFPDSVCILVEDPSGRIILVRQYRESRKAYTLELPGGKIEEGENVDEAGKRELKEETGLNVTSAKLIVSLDMDFSRSIHRTHVLYVSYSHENISTRTDTTPISLTLAEAAEMIETGMITHAPSVVGIRWLQMNLQMNLIDGSVGVSKL